jgi:hypothetical protein
VKQAGSKCVFAIGLFRKRHSLHEAIPYRIDGVFFAAEFLCSLRNRDQNTFENSVLFVDGVLLLQIGFVATGLQQGLWLSSRVARSTGSLRFSSPTAAVSVRM